MFKLYPAAAAGDDYWINVPAGEFVMGGGPSEAENPPHEVKMSAFRLARAQVTRDEYQAFLDATGHQAPEFWDQPEFAHPRTPAVGPSWDDAMAFCSWFSEVSGEPVRLPTEAEWECAAKADRDVKWPWGDEDPEDALPDYENRWQDGPEPVDAYPSLHPWVFLGLGENVHEWCSDWFDAGYYAVSPKVDPQGPDEGHRKASRGGAWRHAVPVSTCTHRSSIPPDRHYTDYGFRLASEAGRARLRDLGERTKQKR